MNELDLIRFKGLSISFWPCDLFYSALAGETKRNAAGK
jgi:hypothetical protein